MSSPMTNNAQAELVVVPDPEATAAHAARVLERMRQTPHGPKRTRLAEQHVDLSNKAQFQRGYLAARTVFRAEIERMAGEVEKCRRTLTDPQRMLWRDDVEGICPTPGGCWEYGDTARCGPCAIKQAKRAGVDSNLGVPNLPAVYRLNREVERLRDLIERARHLIAEETYVNWHEAARQALGESQ